MKPNNLNDSPCTPTSSNCVVWQGPDIPCIKLCKGDNITTVVYNLAKELCDILDQLDVKGYDLSCLNLQGCAPKNFHDLIQLLISTICAQQGIATGAGSRSASTTTEGCPNCIVNMAKCFYYTDPATGDTITTSLLHNYAMLLGSKICTLVSTIETIQAQIENHEERIEALENKPDPTFSLPTMIPVCVMDSVSTPIDQVLIELEKQFCQLQGATGDANKIYQGISKQPANLNNSPALGTAGGTMSGLDGWKNELQNLSDSINNMWLTIADLRSAVTNIKANCCVTACAGIGIKLAATLPNINTLNLFFTGTIPAGLLECDDINHTPFSISDQSGNSINVRVDLINNINNPSGVPITLTGTPLNTSDDFTIHSDMCFKSTDGSGTECQVCLDYTFINTLSCPSVTYNAGLDYIDFLFYHSSGALTYVVELFDNSGNTMLQSATFNVTNPGNVTGSFGSLTGGTNYKIRIRIVKPTGTTICPFTVITTLPDPCPKPQTVIAIISIP